MQVIHIKFIFINFTFLINLAVVNGLVELTSVNDNILVITEAAIRDKVNKLFHLFKLKGINNKAKFKQYSMVHNSLVAIMLRDNENLKTISQLVRVDYNIDNTTVDFMGVVNELLNAEENIRQPNENNENVTDGYVIKYIDDFLSQLKILKEKFGVVDNNANLNINVELAKILAEYDNSNINVTSQNDTNITESSDVLNENDFWEPSGRRIYQGDRTKVFQKFQCSGSIIKSDVIITAASCLQLAWNNRFFRENPSFLAVRVGSSFHNGGGEVIPVLELYFYPNYNPKNLRHNLCLLRLRRHIKTSKNKRVKMIRFDKNPWSLPVDTYGITVLGWGAKRANNIIYDTLQGQLAFTVLDVYPLSECAEIYSREYVSSHNFCGGFFSKGGGACNRDVGGPGVVKGVLAGVISFGSPLCGTPNAPTVFTKLGYYVDWIEDILEQEVPHARQRTTLPPPDRPPIGFPQYSTPTTPFIIGPVFETHLTTKQEAEDIQVVKDEDLFQSFLKTMFGPEDNDSDEIVTETREGDTKLHKPVQNKPEPWVEFATKAFEAGITENYAEEGFTVLEPNLGDIADTDLEKDIARLIDNIDKDDDEDTVGDDATAGKITAIRPPYEKITKGYSKVVSNKPDLPKSIESDDNSQPLILKYTKRKHSKSKKNSVTTPVVLYLSDGDKNGTDSINDDQLGNDDDEVGMSIETDPFKDLSFRQDVQKALYNFLPEELYKLLADTIDSYSDIKNNKNYL